MTSAPVAAIDCGTNSLRLLIAEPGPHGHGVRDLAREMEIVRLGHGVDRTGRFDPAAVERTLAATRRYAELISRHGAQRVRFAATSATRDAENRDDFIRGVQQVLGITPEVITGAEEAELSFRGAVASITDLPAGDRLVVDIGGGSTEFVLGTDQPSHRISLDMGSVRLTERHLHEDPPGPDAIRAATQEIDRLLDEAAQEVPFARARSLVGVAGTVTTMTALCLDLDSYQPEASHGADLPVPDVVQECARILRMSREGRRRLPVIHPGRVDVIGAGALIWSRIIDRIVTETGITSVRTSEHDILDGLALSVIDGKGARPRLGADDESTDKPR